MKINKITIQTFGHGVFAEDRAIVQTDDGDHKYAFTAEGFGMNEAEYIDQVRYDFNNESSIGGGIADSDLFERLEADS